jgi:bacterioferritin (cytochrome b1)
MSNEVLPILNEAIRIEHTLALQCHQYALTVKGLWRLSLAPMLDELGEEARSHARKFGLKVLALGGTPAAQVGEVRTATRAEDIVSDLLRLEREAMACYLRALTAVDEDDVALRTMLEDHIEAEQRHVEELERLIDADAAGASDTDQADRTIRRAS